MLPHVPHSTKFGAVSFILIDLLDRVFDFEILYFGTAIKNLSAIRYQSKDITLIAQLCQLIHLFIQELRNFLRNHARDVSPERGHLFDS